MLWGHLHPLKRPSFRLGIHAQSHARARAQSSQQEFIRIGPASLPPESYGSSARSRCGPIDMSSAYLARVELTTMLLGINRSPSRHRQVTMDEGQLIGQTP